MPNELLLRTERNKRFVFERFILWHLTNGVENGSDDDRDNNDNSDSKHIHNTKRFNARYKTSIELIRAWKTAHGAHKWKPAFKQRVSHVPNTEWKISFPLTFEAIASDLSKANTSNILIRARDNFSFQFKYR